MKRALHTAAAVLALALAGFGLTGCADTDDDCDASSTQVVRYEPAAFDARIGGTSGGRGGGFKARPKSPKTAPKPHKPAGSVGGTFHHHDHDCEDDD